MVRIGPSILCPILFAFLLAITAGAAGCYTQVTVSNPRGATTHDLEPGDEIAIEFVDGHTIKSKFRAMKDDTLETDAGRFPLDRIRKLIYWIEDDMPPIPIPFCMSCGGSGL